nr:hypothetical protein [Tanacetum cinerariifolium]
YELDGITRKHVTVHVLYCPNPSRLCQRFPFIDSSTLKGFPFEHIRGFRRRNYIIAVKFTCLKELQIHVLVVFGEDLERLATSRGKDVRVLNINKCRGYWEEGLMHVAMYCNQLRTFSLERPGISNEDFGKWLHELAIHNTVLESFHCRFDWFEYYRYDVQGWRISGAYYGKVRTMFSHRICVVLYIKVRRLIDISNEAMECVGTHLKNLRNSRLGNMGKQIWLDNGIELC